MQEYLKDFQMVFVNMLTDDGMYVCMLRWIVSESTMYRGGLT